VTEITDFGLIVLAVSGTVFVALLGMRVADRFSVPYAALFLVATVALTETFSSLDDIVSIRKVERLTVVALVVILFDGGLHIGLGRFRRSAGPILALGVLGTPDHGRARRTGRALRPRLRVDPRRARRCGDRADRPCGDVLGLRLA
jgi:hypothetical protein